MGVDPAALGRSQDHLFRFGDEIADGEDQPIGTDDHGVADPLGAEGLGGEGVFADARFQDEDRGERLVQIERHRLRARTQGFFNFQITEWRRQGDLRKASIW
jgi:hypothetical protein